MKIVSIVISVTSVGATQGVGTEEAASFSSGGFSDIFPIPSFQSAAVAEYLEVIGDLNSGKFNGAGRGFPDVAFNGVDFNIIVNGDTMKVDGTSCSTPSLAAFIGLIDTELMDAHEPVLGWLNTFLYQAGPNAIVDITSGDNPGCGTNGFPTERGWDPVCHFRFTIHRSCRANSFFDLRSLVWALPCLTHFCRLLWSFSEARG